MFATMHRDNAPLLAVALVFPAITVLGLDAPLQLIMHGIHLLRGPKNLILNLGI
jgi:hypothetical protein